MKFRAEFVRVGMTLLLFLSPFSVVRHGYAASTPQLLISQFKLTSSAGQFITLYNQSSNLLDLTQYEIDYINSSGKLTSLPIGGQLAAHSFYMLSDDQVRLCYQMTINATSLGLATTNGTLQLWQLSADKTSKTLQDSLTWASKTTAGAVTLPTQNSTNTVSLLRQPTDSLGNPQVTVAGGGSWQAVAPDIANPCTLDIINTTSSTASPSGNPGNQLGVGQTPPSTIINLASDDVSNAAALPGADIGLAAPQITELLPNPTGTGNDGTDEFVELYNSNTVPFDLTGFTLQTGSTTKHSYVFPTGTILPPQSFVAFYSGDTGLSLSNTSGAADLLDPFGNTLSQTDAYGTAKDGQAWALAGSRWYWTTAATPNAVNVIKQVTTASKTKKSSTNTKSSSAVKGAATTTSNGGAQNTAATTATPAPVHPYVLAAVAVAALGYGVYEYRHDVANRFHQFRTNRTARRAARS